MGWDEDWRFERFEKIFHILLVDAVAQVNEADVVEDARIGEGG